LPVADKAAVGDLGFAARLAPAVISRALAQPVAKPVMAQCRRCCLSHDHHRARCVLGDAVCGRAEQVVADEVASVAEHDQVVVSFACNLWDQFGSVPGALVAGLLIGVIQSLSAYLLGPIYKDIIVYAMFVALLWIRPTGLFGKAA